MKTVEITDFIKDEDFEKVKEKEGAYEYLVGYCDALDAYEEFLPSKKELLCIMGILKSQKEMKAEYFRFAEAICKRIKNLKISDLLF